MDENILILTRPEGYHEYVTEVAGREADDLGLVLTHISLADEKVSGGRVEEEREYGGATYETFDEPVFIGSAIAQLAGHVDGVVVDRLDVWAGRLLQRFGDDRVERDAEILSLVSVMKARMSGLILVTRPDHDDPAVAQIVADLRTQIEPHCDRVIDHTGAAPRALKGELPD